MGVYFPDLRRESLRVPDTHGVVAGTTLALAPRTFYGVRTHGSPEGVKGDTLHIDVGLATVPCLWESVVGVVHSGAVSGRRGGKVDHK